MSKDLGDECGKNILNVSRGLKIDLSNRGWNILDEVPTIRGYIILSPPTGYAPSEDTRNRLSIVLRAHVFFEGEPLPPHIQKYSELIKDFRDAQE